jgi:hypothetical protein
MDVEMAQIEAGVLHSLHHLGQHLDPRAAAVPVPHIASLRPECGSDPTFGCVSTVASRNADLPRAGVDRLVVDPYATSAPPPSSR